MQQKQVKVWVCPTPGCTNYFGSSSQEPLDLTQERALGRAEDRENAHGQRLIKGLRSDCPDCKQRGLIVARAACYAVVQVPESAPLREGAKTREELLDDPYSEHPLHRQPGERSEPVDATITRQPDNSDGI